MTLAATHPAVLGQRTARDQDTTRFLTDTQKRFYDETAKYLRELGFQGQITASNWVTASPEVLGPLEKLAPGASTTHVEYWTIIDDLARPETDVGFAKLAAASA